MEKKREKQKRNHKMLLSLLCKWTKTMMTNGWLHDQISRPWSVKIDCLIKVYVDIHIEFGFQYDPWIKVTKFVGLAKIYIPIWLFHP